MFSASYINVCNRDDPQLSECIKCSIIALLPRLKVDIPELNVPSIEPLALPGSALDTSSENLFNSDPVLGKGANDAINENIGSFFEELRPNFEEVLSNRFTDIANKITKTFDYDDLFPKGS
ncbi:hypothetical protein ILUMI_04162 [Ignelater luminosus]|uniref:Uncharacterized protein n=1 Tax=Ignelater luminosus TaxID=2038154 RepID=A0A8K0GEU0_IGNLU|nr:hypothetical protein ILUMI_04162 [Ignelater luminosus]